MKPLDLREDLLSVSIIVLYSNVLLLHNIHVLTTCTCPGLATCTCPNYMYMFWPNNMYMSGPSITCTWTCTGLTTCLMMSGLIITCTCTCTGLTNVQLYMFIYRRGGIDPPYATSTYTRDDLKRNHWKSFLK